MESLVIEAEWIVPVESPAIRWGFLVIRQGRILHIGEELPASFAELPRYRLSGGAILPGLINAHCHLELSDIDEPLEVPDSGNRPSMVGWLRKVMARRKSIVESGVDVERIKQTAIESGIRSAWEAGTRIVVDNITAPWSSAWCQEASARLGQSLLSEASCVLAPETPILIKPCIELVDVTQARGKQTWEFAQQAMNSIQDAHPVCIQPLGLAPHAPYTASKQIVRRAAHATMKHGGLLSMHLAESLEELEYIQKRKGAFQDWISMFIDAEHARQIGTIDEHLAGIAGSHRGLIAHGNYLTESQIATLESLREKIAVVYCPRTHHHFRHAEHPARQLKTKDIPLFLGTDSKASNPDLSLFEEWRFACNAFPDLGAKYWMSACTTSPANFLGVEKIAGTLRVGNCSLLTWIPIHSTEVESEEQLWQTLPRSQRAIPLEIQINHHQGPFN